MANRNEYTFDVVNERKQNVTTNPEEIINDPMAWFQGADVVWMLISTTLVMLMPAGIGFFHSGVSKRNSAMSMIWISFLAMSVIGIQWYLVGYGIAFGKSDNPFVGSIEGFALKDVLTRPVGNRKGPPIPELLFALFHGAFAAFTASLIGGAAVQKYQIVHFLVFIFIWTTFVYAPIAHWTWSPSGWSNKLGSLDFAGGTAVHMNGACSAAVCSVFFKWKFQFYWSVLAKRQGTTERRRQQEPQKGQEQEVPEEMHGPNVIPSQSEVESAAEAAAFPKDHRNPDNVFHVVLGTVLLWIGWMGFNGGSTLGVSLRTVSALISTNLAACSGGLTWCFCEFFFSKYDTERKVSGSARQPSRPRRLSIIAFCNGVVSGLITITPAAGYVPLHTAICFGVLGAVFSNLANGLSKHMLDKNDIFAIHGVSGFVGMCLTGIFARADIAHLDGYTTIPGGALNGNGKQIGLQLMDAIAGGGYAAVGTLVILIVMEVVRYIVTRGGSVKVVRAIFDEDQIVEWELQKVDGEV
ncbi:Rh-like protein/ammonium transporter [Choiromyces venosus 120613-1]|uniref:Rh-like protein/ammonium transporter n=1 Tax=Choiromyces venosus 120613-1 TaxID=1336337 RepID=A0A3N4K573_9PEZI|nr:Rh-like protein/ammonium transporter [Choiromyces venosus 120613-1]